MPTSTARSSTAKIQEYCQKAIEIVFIGALFIAPWLFGSAGPTGQFLLTLGWGVAVFAFIVWLVSGDRLVWRGGLEGLGIVVGLAMIGCSAAIHLLFVPESIQSFFAPGMSTWQGLIPADAWPRASTAAGPMANQSFWFASNRLGLNPGGSFQFLINTIIAITTFVMAACLRAPESFLRRIAWSAVVVGLGVSIFGIAQHVGSHDGLAYWTYEIEGGLGFGPFINRNHYPFFMNLCLGLSIGLLLDRLAAMGRHWPTMLFSDSTTSWLLVAIAFMAASIIICVSRGGVISAVLAIMIMVTIHLNLGQAAKFTAIGLAVAVPVTLIMLWVGFEIAESRLTMIAETDRYSSDGRWHLWRVALATVPDFPWFGSGGETFRYWETIYTSSNPRWNSAGMKSIRADNEFLDVLNEYGILGFAGLILALAAVIRTISKSARTTGLAAGACIGLLAVCFHSVVDFGLRVPATGFFATVVAGLLVSLPKTKPHRGSGRSRRGRQRAREFADSGPMETRRETPSEPQPLGREWWIRLGIGVVLGLAVLMVFRIKRGGFDSYRFRKSAEALTEVERYEDAAESMRRAATAVPWDVTSRLDYVRTLQLAIRHSQADASRAVAATKILNQGQLINQQCPLVWQPYAYTVQYGSDQLAPAERLKMLSLARRFHPGEPNVALLVGRGSLNLVGLDAAIPSYRDALKYSPRYASFVVDDLGHNLSTQQVTEQLLPADPETCLKMAEEFAERGMDDLSIASAETAFRQLKAPDQLDRNFEPGQIEFFRSEALKILDKPQEALDAMRQAVNQNPKDVPMRLRLAQMYFEADRLEEATREVRICLQFKPGDGAARRLQEEINRRKSGPSALIGT
ncbi:O-Antigen ligase [Crateriforma conspicua]|uniref:O-Antigen ligase n=1 Tax=Crateriforma conspicua TaxID=2527996 RepID=A0A5C6FIZ9_9PLAN|nr:O-antigen ligase family protein [Crateriforma conspicua]TWU59666.1 O-Antigen ligase [Crateriforma conspicua]